MRSYQFYYIDAFTDTMFAGNPCAVFPEAEGLGEEEMQRIARETNLNETAFVLESGEADFKVRYFTPSSEIPFAGHPTIATAFLLASRGYITASEARGGQSGGPAGEQHTAAVTEVRSFEFKVGVLPVELVFEGGRPVKAGMEQKPPEYGDRLESGAVAAAVGLAESDLQPNVAPQVVSTGVPFLIVPVRSAEAVARAQMDSRVLASLLQGSGADAAFVCAPEGHTEEGDTFSRLLSPVSNSEDTFTGSASGCMGSLMYRSGLLSSGRMVLEQGHTLGRPGTGELQLEGSPEQISRVRLYGAAVESLRGVLELP
jgi:trans-2,3-dihydro-3-hydroxyanthranilate isomerase